MPALLLVSATLLNFEKLLHLFPVSYGSRSQCFLCRCHGVREPRFLYSPSLLSLPNSTCLSRMAHVTGCSYIGSSNECFVP